MLRGRNESEPRPGTAPAGLVGGQPGATGWPARDQAYALEERPAGICFYQARASFWLPYHLLQTMQCLPERLTLAFATDDVVLTGRGLHELYVHLAWQAVSRVVEQGDRYAEVADVGVYVARLERTPTTSIKSRTKAGAAESDPPA